ncbi:MAG TPA: beta-galactosidase [Acidobacteriota bacterium]|nr:beta-galactosidase [Acidobacteriota bacterium]
MRKLTISVLVLTLCLTSKVAPLSSRQANLPQNGHGAEVSKTVLSNGTILLNGRPFPMVMDAGTDCFTPQDYDLVMGSKDAFGANTWWFQYAMRHMKSETEGDFEGLARALDFFDKTGIKVNLYLRAEYRDLPEWFYRNNHDYRMLDPAGKPVGQQICLQHEGFRRLVDQYLRRAVRVARSKPSLLMYSIYDEFCIRGWGCFCPRCIGKYRTWLQSEYQSLRKLNDAWKSSYGSWEQIDAPRTQSFDRNYRDWQQYRLKVLEDFGSLYYRAVKEEDPDHLVWIDINMDLYGYTWQRLCVWWKLTSIFDAFNLGPDSIADAGAIRTAMNRAIRDNYAKAATWHLGISHTDFTGRPELYSLLFESNHGGLVWWYSFWDTLQSDQAWGVGNEAETPLRANWFAAREVNYMVRYLDDLYTNTRPVRGEVGVFVSGTTDMLRSLTAHQVMQSEDPLNLGGLCQILRDLNIPYEAIGEDQLGQLGSFKAILLGQFSMCADQATIDAIRQYVRGGGMLLVTNYAFSADANGLEAANPAWGMDELWGSTGQINDQTTEGRITASGAQSGTLQESIRGLSFPTLGGVARRKMGTALVIARFQDGTPAITLNRYGKGQVLFIGTNAGEAYNTGHFLEMGSLPPGVKTRLDAQTYRQLAGRFKGWRNYAVLVRSTLQEAGIRSPVRVSAGGRSELTGMARVSLQEERNTAGPAYHLLVVTLEPIHHAEAKIQRRPNEFLKPEERTMENLSLTAGIPHPERVKAVYRIPPIGYEMGKIEVLPEKLPFEVRQGEIWLTIPKISEVACILVAQDARPLVGVKSDHISAEDGKPTRVLVTVDNAAGLLLSGGITFPTGFNAVPAEAKDVHFEGLKPGGHHECEFAVTTPSPIERNRTFQAIVNYRLEDGRTGTSRSYPITSRTDERIARGWVKRVEADMAESAQPPTPYGPLYEQALQQRELVYAAYNSGAYADVVRLAREHGRLCAQIKERRKPKSN